MDGKWRNLFEILAMQKVGKPVHSAQNISTLPYLPVLDYLVCSYRDTIRYVMSVFKTPTVGDLTWLSSMYKGNEHFT